ncbi:MULTISPECIES: SDR family oxidoreductase [unclassified Acidisoma]|jgi:short-subunit dehydrogenase|uniref:SDR family oxidoreductase n=1 Tax=unclassified Acidisoma TaxID=2634065 RepID=UPI00131A6859|nr:MULTISPECIES: SDR family oxidoreductase [unclassified Acidisoma]
MTPGAPRVVVITGGSSGIGRCAATLFARRGWRVGLIARGALGLAAAAAEVTAAGGVAATAVADVTDSAALGNAADDLAATLGPIDAWVNCAGNGVYGRFLDVPEDQFRQVTEVTYLGAVNGTRIALLAMQPRNRGTIVNVCSGVAFHGLPLMTSYSGAKAALRGFAQALRVELAIEHSRIRLSAVFPPAINTPFFSHAASHMGWPARPVPPVYQPEVAAEGVYLAATTGRAEVIVSGTMSLFSLLTRAAPVWTGFIVRRLGIEGNLTRDPAALRLQECTLFAPSVIPGGMHGPFGHRARRWSMQMALQKLRARIVS